MSEFSSYNSQYLDKTLNKIEQELIAYKATQAYGAAQIQSRAIVMPGTVSATAHTIYSSTSYWIMAKITFRGVNKDKLARGALTWTTTANIWSWYLCESSENHAVNEMKWIVVMQGGSAFNASFQAYMNMNGSLSYETLF